MSATEKNTFPYLEHLPHTPQIMIDTTNLISHFYKNSPPLESRVLGIALKFTVQEFYLKDNALSKDGNPVVTNVIREGTNVIPLSYNSYMGAKHISGRNETLEGLYLLGQESRFLCKAVPQYLSGGDVTHARILNIVCDSPSIIGNHLSKISQHDPNKKIYWAYKGSEDNIEYVWAGQFIKENTPFEFIKASIITAGVKAVILDQLGEIIKITTKSPLISIPYKHIELLETQLTNTISSPVISKLTISTFSILNKALPDLFITGVFMLSMSNDIINSYNTATPSEQNAIIFNGAALFISKYSLTYVLSLSDESVIYFPSLLPNLLNLKEVLNTFAAEAPGYLPYLAPLLLPLISDTCYNYLKEAAIENTEYLYTKQQEYISYAVESSSPILETLCTKGQEYISNTMDFFTGKEATYSDEL